MGFIPKIESTVDLLFDLHVELCKSVFVMLIAAERDISKVIISCDLMKLCFKVFLGWD